MARYGRVSVSLLMVSVLLSVAGCTGMDAAGGGAVAEQLQSFAPDFLRQVLAALVL